MLADSLTDGGFALYVHWPFCEAKCPYCDFNSHVRGGVDQGAGPGRCWPSSTFCRADARPHALRSIFFGGGTPSLMEPATVGGGDRAARPALAVRAATSRSRSRRTRPRSRPSVFAAFAAAGRQPRLAGRAGARRRRPALPRPRAQRGRGAAAVELARADLPALSFDLIYARPGQTEAAGAAELDAGARPGRRHLSLYQLTIEPGTPLPRAARARRAGCPSTRTGGRPLRDHPGDARGGRPAGLRDLQPRAAGRRMPPQPRLLALRRLCRRRPRRPWPADARWREARHRHPAAPERWLAPVEAAATARRRARRRARGAGDRTADDGAAPGGGRAGRPDRAGEWPSAAPDRRCEGARCADRAGHVRLHEGRLGAPAQDVSVSILCCAPWSSRLQAPVRRTILLQ